MKKSFLIVAAAALAMGATFSSCGKKSVATIAGEKKVTVPCADKTTDKDYFRGFGVGQSRDLNTARQKARMAANEELASSMNTTIQSALERYVNDAGNVPADFSQTFQGMSKQLVNQEINNVEISCQETTTADGMYKLYMAVQASKKEVLEKLERQAAADQKLETLFNREKFREQFNADMAEFKKNN